jgi:hypothetical protein
MECGSLGEAMRRRDFVTLFSGTALVLPFAARAAINLPIAGLGEYAPGSREGEAAKLLQQVGIDLAQFGSGGFHRRVAMNATSAREICAMSGASPLTVVSRRELPRKKAASGFNVDRIGRLRRGRGLRGCALRRRASIARCRRGRCGC